MIRLRETLTVDGDTTILNWAGGRLNLTAFGTFGGGNVTLYYDNSGGANFVPGQEVFASIPTTVMLTANGGISADIPQGSAVKATLAGSAAASVTIQIAS